MLRASLQAVDLTLSWKPWLFTVTSYGHYQWPSGGVWLQRRFTRTQLTMLANQQFIAGKSLQAVKQNLRSPQTGQVCASIALPCKSHTDAPSLLGHRCVTEHLRTRKPHLAFPHGLLILCQPYGHISFCVTSPSCRDLQGSLQHQVLIIDFTVISK